MPKTFDSRFIRVLTFVAAIAAVVSPAVVGQEQVMNPAKASSGVETLRSWA